MSSQLFTDEQANSGSNLQMILAAIKIKIKERDYQASAETCEEVLKQQPNQNEIRFLLALSYDGLDKVQDATKEYDRLLRRMPKHPPFLAAAANFYRKTKQLKKAEKALQKLLIIQPDNVAIMGVMATTLEQANKLPKAWAIINRGLKIMPQNCNLLYTKAVLLRRQEDYGEAITCLEQIDDDQWDTKAYKYFELGKNYDCLKKYDEAFEAFTKAQEIKRAHLQIQRQSKNILLEEIADMKRLFRTPFIHKPTQDQNIKIHFMVGFPRSGTTLLSHALGAHPDVVMLEETPILRRVYHQIVRDLDGYLDKVHDFTVKDIKHYQDLYIDHLKTFTSFQKDKIYIDKMPVNMVMAGLMHMLFPQAKYILSLRHPCDAMLSNYMQNFENNSAMNNMGRLEDIAHLYEESFSTFLDFESKSDIPVLKIRYEDLIEDFQRDLQKVCAFLDIEYHKNLENYRRQITQVNTISYQQVVKPIYKTAQARWLNYEKHLEPYIPSLDPYIEMFGYNQP